jgi:hypothetical protein
MRCWGFYRIEPVVVMSGKTVGDGPRETGQKGWMQMLH